LLTKKGEQKEETIDGYYYKELASKLVC